MNPNARCRIALTALASLVCCVSQAQEETSTFRSQLSFTCDNNFFLFDGDDGYYTNGVFLRYDRLGRPSTDASVKKIFSYEIGQMIFDAHSRKILPNVNSQGIPSGLSQIDRPIAGYLYGKVTQTTFSADKRMLSYGISIGTIGDNSFGQEAQEFWHKIIGVKEYWNWVWDYQVKNEVGMNLHGTFAQALIKPREPSFIQITSVTQATLGTTFTNLTQSVVLQIGKLRAISSSSYWNSRLQWPGSSNRKQDFEIFAYYKPSVRYQVYNATVQGGMFTNDKGPIVAGVQPFVFAHEVGVRFSLPRYGLGYQITFQSKEALGQFYRQSFASLFLAYRF